MQVFQCQDNLSTVQSDLLLFEMDPLHQVCEELSPIHIICNQTLVSVSAKLALVYFLKNDHSDTIHISINKYRLYR